MAGPGRARYGGHCRYRARRRRAGRRCAWRWPPDRATVRTSPGADQAPAPRYRSIRAAANRQRHPSRSARRRRRVVPASAPPHVARARRHLHRQAFHRVGERDLAGEPAGARGADREIEHILLLLAWWGELVGILGRDDDVAGRTRHLPLARPLERLAIGLCEIKQAIAGPTTRFLDAGAVGADEADEDHAATRCASAAAMMSAIAAVNSSSRSEEHTSELQSLMRNTDAVFGVTKQHHRTSKHSIK